MATMMKIMTTKIKLLNEDPKKDNHLTAPLPWSVPKTGNKDRAMNEITKPINAILLFSRIDSIDNTIINKKDILP